MLRFHEIVFVMQAHGRCRAGRSRGVHCVEDSNRASITLGMVPWEHHVSRVSRVCQGCVKGVKGQGCQGVLRCVKGVKGVRGGGQLEALLLGWIIRGCHASSPKRCTSLKPCSELVGAPCMLIWLGGHGPRGIGFLLPCTLTNSYTNVEY